VLLQETLHVLDPRAGMTVVDGTVGAGGHAAAIAAAIGPGGVLIGLDRDAEILAHAEAALVDACAASGVRLHLVRASFEHVERVLAELGAPGCDRLLLDLGVSSLQLDSPQRGFSFMHDGPLDMRMSTTDAPTAAEWLRSVAPSTLEQVLREYGEERHARRIARAIVTARRRAPIETTGQLADIVRAAAPRGAGRQRIHPATRTFQAVRIAVNDELGVLARGLAAAERVLRDGGRLAVIAFHSLEDRLVKRFLRERMTLPFRKPLRAGAEEIGRNPRARSARLRCGIRGGSA
jgi:16S rRNA (cytosine1402-N4)-methyltransferase